MLTGGHGVSLGSMQGAVRRCVWHARLCCFACVLCLRLSTVGHPWPLDHHVD